MLLCSVGGDDLTRVAPARQLTCHANLLRAGSGGTAMPSARAIVIVAHIDPQPTGPPPSQGHAGPTESGRQHRDSRVVTMDLLGGEDVLAD